MNKYTANQDIRDYMADHGVTQKMLAEALDTSVWAINTKLKVELTQADKEVWLNHIDALATKNLGKQQPEEEPEEVEEETDEVVYIRFNIGDRVKIPSKQNIIAVVTDIWQSQSQVRTMYEVTREVGGAKGMYSENQLEPAPIPTEYRFESTIDGNVAVVTMIAIQGDKTWIYARGHAHILHDGEVGMAQAISYAARRMFEAIDSKQENKIYVRGGNN